MDNSNEMYATKYCVDKNNNSLICNVVSQQNKDKIKSIGDIDLSRLSKLDEFIHKSKLKMKAQGARPVAVFLTVSIKPDIEVNKFLNSVRSHLKKHVIKKRAMILSKVSKKNRPSRFITRLSKFVHRSDKVLLDYFGYQEFSKERVLHHHLVLVFDKKKFKAHTILKALYEAAPKFLSTDKVTNKVRSPYLSVKAGKYKEYSLVSQSKECIQHTVYCCKKKTKVDAEGRPLPKEPATNLPKINKWLVEYNELIEQQEEDLF
jgi:hypothetical protein